MGPTTTKLGDSLMKYSVVIPIKNEEENILTLYHEVEKAMDSLKEPWELIYIEDGSTDNSREVLETLAQKKGHCRVLVFDKNYGQSSSFDAGFHAARGEYVVSLDDSTESSHRRAR